MSEERTAEKDALVDAGVITTCREELGSGERCDQPAEFVLWGKLLPPEALGPRCYGHAANHTHWTMPSRPTQWAVIDLRPFRRAFESNVFPPGSTDAQTPATSHAAGDDQHESAAERPGNGAQSAEQTSGASLDVRDAAGFSEAHSGSEVGLADCGRRHPGMCAIVGGVCLQPVAETWDGGAGL